MTKESYHPYQGSVWDYAQLLKPRVMSLVIFSAWVGLVVGKATAQIYQEPITLPPLFQILVILFIALGAGAAGALNMWIDRDLDATMMRTMNRPLPQKKMPPSEALAFGLIFSLFAILLLSFVSNYWAGGLLAVTIFYYAVIYSLYLKKRHVYNVVIGGVAGALPPVIGFMAVLPSLHWQGWLLFLVILFWTPPHSWALAIFRADDYKKAKIKMLPNQAGFAHTAKQIFIYSLLLLLAVSLFFYADITSIYFNIFAFFITFVFVVLSWRFIPIAHDKSLTILYAKKFFGYSILYLFVLLLFLLFDIGIKLL